MRNEVDVVPCRGAEASAGNRPLYVFIQSTWASVRKKVGRASPPLAHRDCRTMVMQRHAQSSSFAMGRSGVLTWFSFSASRSRTTQSP